MRTSKVLTVIGIVAGAVAIAFVIGWLASREPKSADTPDTPTTGTAGTAKTPGTGSPTSPVAGGVEPTIEPVTNEVSTETSVNETNMTAKKWEEKFDALWEEDIDTDKMAAKMLEIYPHLSEEMKKDAIEHILNLVPDEGFGPVGKILVDPKTPEEIADDIMTDIGNRPGTLRMPLLLEVAKNPDHPKAAEAKELLELYVEPEEDPGTNWEAWAVLIEKYLQENPD